jgi:hypothetical protein
MMSFEEYEHLMHADDVPDPDGDEDDDDREVPRSPDEEAE